MAETSIALQGLAIDEVVGIAYRARSRVRTGLAIYDAREADPRVVVQRHPVLATRAVLGRIEAVEAVAVTQVAVAAAVRDVVVLVTLEAGDSLVHEFDDLAVVD